MSSQNPNPKGVVRYGWLGFMTLLAVLYLQEGTGQPGGLLSQSLTYLLVKTGWSMTGMSWYMFFVMLPWYVKPIWGMVIDRLPLFGYRFKGYLIASNIVAAVGFFLVSKTDSTWLIGGSLFLTALGMAITTTVAGKMIVEHTKATGQTAGIFVSQQWLFYSVAIVGTSYFGGVLTEQAKDHPVEAVEFIGLLLAFGPLAVVLSVIALIDEKRMAKTAPKARLTAAQRWAATIAEAKSVWKTIVMVFTDRTVVLVACFIFAYFYSPGWGAPMFKYQTEVLHFHQDFIGMLGVYGALSSIVGGLACLVMFRFVPLKWILVGTIVVGAVLQLGYLLMVDQHLALQVTSLLPIGAERAALFAKPENVAVVLSVLGGSLSLVAIIAPFSLAVDYCPDGAEGFTYACLMMVHNLANPASSLSGGVLYDHGMSLWWLIVVSSAVTLIALLILPKLGLGNELSGQKRQKPPFDKKDK